VVVDVRPPWFLTREDPAWPPCLDELDAAGERPVEGLHGLGDKALLRDHDLGRTVTIVGARKSGSYGRGVARELAFCAASAGLLVVSGMALGCDSAAHEGALDANGPTVAVLAGPVDVPYPPSKRHLYERILLTGGAVLSEQPSGTAVNQAMFPARNRIMAALAGTVVIVEGAHRSGTQHTVRQAMSLGRAVLAVPGPVTSSLSELPNQLLSEGAAIVRGAQDLLDQVLGPGETQAGRAGPPLDGELTRALLAVETGAETCDALAVALGSDGGDAAVALARLELLGYVVADDLGRYSRTSLSAAVP
jgi:DNA processing protein